MREIPFSEITYTFTTPPLLIGGMAMEFYGLRLSGSDIDFVVTHADYDGLAELYPATTRDLYGDLGVCPGKFEFWTSICLFDYAALSAGAIDRGQFRVIALEKLLLLKALGIHEIKYENDLRMIARKIADIQYGKDRLPE